MDNLTHGLFGYALGRTLSPCPPKPREQNALIWTSVLASNAPDLDLVMRFFVEDPKLAYLVHHRGHTHTLLWAIPLGLALGWGVALLCGLRDRASVLRVAAIGALAGALHIVFDAFNNYGVHPFYPVDNRWLYGDAVFIVEPFLWTALLPLPAFTGHTRWGRVLAWLLVGAFALLLFVVRSVLGPVNVGIQLVALVAALAYAHFRGTTPRKALSSVVLLVALLFGTSQLAKNQIVQGFHTAHPDEQLVDIARAPLPGNPLCWDAVVVSVADTVGAGQSYRARKAQLSLLPGWLSTDDCRPAIAQEGTATLDYGSTYAEAGFALSKAFAAPLDTLRSLDQENCRAHAALLFLRAPFWSPGDGQTEAENAGLIGDLRYDREPDPGFSEIPLQGSCRDPIADWTPPRSDLLEPQGRQL